VAHQTFAVLAESDNGRGGAETFRVSDDDRLAAFHHGHAAVGRTKVNTDNLAHNESPIFKFLPPANQSERGDFLRPYISKTRAKSKKRPFCFVLKQEKALGRGKTAVFHNGTVTARCHPREGGDLPVTLDPGAQR